MDLDRVLFVILLAGNILDQGGPGKCAMDTLFARLEEIRVDEAFGEVHRRIEVRQSVRM